MRVKKSEKIIISVTVIIMLLVIILGLSYAVFTYDTKQDNPNDFIASCYNVTYEEDGEKGFTIDPAMPVADSTGMQQPSYKLTMTNNCQTTVSYKIMLNILNDNTTPPELMKVGVNNTVKYIQKLEKGESSLTEKKEAYRIEMGNIDANESITYEFRTWMDINSTEGEDTKFSGKISVELSPKPLLASTILLKSTYPTVQPNFNSPYPSSSAPNDTSQSGLYATEDNDGTSYYYRGIVNNNYVSFAGFTWKIVRINGDGTIRMMLNGTEETNGYGDNYNEAKFVGWTYDNEDPCTIDNPCVTNFENGAFVNEGKFTDNRIKRFVQDWYTKNLTKDDNKIAMSRFCSDTSYYRGSEEDPASSNLLFNTQARSGLNKPSLICPDPVKADGNLRDYGGNYLSKVGLITVDELIFAGAKYYTAFANTNYLYGLQTWTMSPRNFDNVAVIWYNSTDSFKYTDTSFWIKYLPVINLKSDTEFKTEKAENPGTIDNPYIVQ